MGQIGTKIYQKACIYDHSVNGDFGLTGISMGMSIIGGDSIIGIYYTVLEPLVLVGAAVAIQAGWAFNGYTDMINPVHTVAVMNANIGYWLTFPTLVQPVTDKLIFAKQPIGNTFNNSIGLTVVDDPGTITAGKILFSFTLMSHAL